MNTSKGKVFTFIRRRCVVCLAGALALGAGIGNVRAADPPATQPTVSGPVLDAAIAAQVRDSIAQDKYQRSDVRGGAFGKHAFEDLCPDGVLIGFRIGLGHFFSTEVIKYIQPIYLTPHGEVIGEGFGNEDDIEHRVVAKAPPGYAIGALAVRGGGGLDALTITYMRFNGTRLDPTDTQVTPRIGGGSEGTMWVDGDGTPVIGICGHANDDGEWLGIGLVFVKPTAMVQHQ